MTSPINKNSVDLPDWMFGAVIPNNKKEGMSNAISIKNDADVISAKASIEKSAKDGKSAFVVSDKLSDSQKSELTEYAQACGTSVEHISESQKTVASLKPEVRSENKEKFPDPLGVFNSFSSFQDKSKDAADVGKDKNSVIRVGGNEVYEAQRNSGVRPGENSIASPNNIKDSLDSKDKSSKDIILEQNRERRDKVAFDSKKWQQDYMDALPKKDDVPMAIRDNKMTSAAPEHTKTKFPIDQHTIGGKDVILSMPDKTAGELLSDKSKSRKEEIQRPKSDDRSWDTVTSSKKEVISDLFFEELKKNLGKS